MMNIRYKTAAGRVVELGVDTARSTVASLRRKIGDETGDSVLLPPTFRGAVLADDQARLVDCNIGEGATVCWNGHLPTDWKTGTWTVSWEGAASPPEKLEFPHVTGATITELEVAFCKNKAPAAYRKSKGGDAACPALDGQGEGQGRTAAVVFNLAADGGFPRRRPRPTTSTVVIVLFGTPSSMEVETRVASVRASLPEGADVREGQVKRGSSAFPCIVARAPSQCTVEMHLCI